MHPIWLIPWGSIAHVSAEEAYLSLNSPKGRPIFVSHGIDQLQICTPLARSPLERGLSVHFQQYPAATLATCFGTISKLFFSRIFATNSSGAPHTSKTYSSTLNFELISFPDL